MLKELIIPEYPKFKVNLYPYLIDDKTIRLGGIQDGLARDIITSDAKIVLELLVFMNGDKTLNDICDFMKSTYNINKEETESMIKVLIEKGCIEDPAGFSAENFLEEEKEMYQRSVNLFSWMDKTERINHWELQNKLKNSRVGILGVGGVGSHVAISLARMGVGEIKILDFDIVERSNLNRQVLFEENDIGNSKVEVAKKRLESINPYIKVEAINKVIQNVDDIIDFGKDIDLLMLCADEPRYKIDRYTNRAIHILKIPLITASYASTVVNYRTVIPGKTPCLECLYLKQMKHMAYSETITSGKMFGRRNAVTAPIAGLTGNLSSNEAVLLLTGLKSSSSPNNFQLDLYSMEVHDIQLDFIDECPVCNNPYDKLDIER